jgi:hypothetical protein
MYMIYGIGDVCILLIEAGCNWDLHGKYDEIY